MDQNHHHNHTNTSSHRPRGRGRGGRRGRGGNGFRGPRADTLSTQVPSSSQVIPGAGVSIVLKIDQPTGHQVQGIVSEVLGRGDHPRGIKVRLVDGRVGRVQAIVSEEVAREASAGLANLGRNGGSAGVADSLQNERGGRRGRRGQFTDMRYDDAYDYESSQASRDSPNLLDYVRTRRVPTSKSYTNVRGEDDTPLVTQSEATASDKIVCPVCGDFEGDEGAVAFHANSHFD